MYIKKITSAFMLFFLCACIRQGPLIKDESSVSYSNASAQAEKTNVRRDEKNHISEIDLKRYKENIIEKRRTETSVSYEYRDVRIDELSPLAAHYCNQKDQTKTAKLREIVMRENHSRLATFDCVDLQ